MMYAQDIQSLSGTWIHSEFLNTLKTTSRVDSAFHKLNNDEPLYLLIDAEKLHHNVLVAYTPQTTTTMDLEKMIVGKMGERWCIGQDSVRWILSTDSNRSVLTLFNIKNLEQKPIVLGKLPSKNQDPDYLLSRTINASVLMGKFQDGTGKLYQFSNAQRAMFADSLFTYTIVYSPNSSQITITDIATKKKYHITPTKKGIELVPVTATGKKLVKVQLTRVQDTK